MSAIFNHININSHIHAMLRQSLMSGFSSFRAERDTQTHCYRRH